VDDVDTLVCPVGLGGLLAGISTAVKSRLPEVTIYGVEPDGAPSLTSAIESGKPVGLGQEIDTTIDGASTEKIGTLTFERLKKVGAKAVTVTVDQARRSVTNLWEREPRPLRVEMAAGMVDAALREMPQEDVYGKKVVLFLSGKSLDEDRYVRQVRLV
jgi:threonine dehydratase